MNQTGNRNSILGWVKNLKRNTLLNESLDEINDELSGSESRSPSRSSFQSGAFSHPSVPFPASPTKEKSIPHSPSGMGGASEFLRPLLSHKSRSTNNVNNRSDSISRSLSNHDSSVGLRQRRDSFLQNNPLVDENSKYFGVSLEDAINQAAAKISILGSESSNVSDDDVLHYGRIPIVVAKCGVYLKKNGLNVEGIFRVGGSSKRIKELQIIFNSPPEFGKKLNWDGYTVHDAASVLRRYLNALPEPLIPLDLYEEFRDPLRSRPRIIKYLKYKADNSQKVTRKNTVSVAPPVALADQTESSANTSDPSSLAPAEQENVKPKNASTENTTVSHSTTEGLEQEIPSSASKTRKRPKSYKNLTRDVYKAIDDYKLLLDDLPCLSKQLLFYILDLLAMVQSFSSENLMSSRNLAAIFQPSILLHPSHDMHPEEYALSQSVVEFLIQYSYKLLPNSDTRPESSSSASVESARPTESKAPTPTRIPSRRQHSKSLSTPNHDLDFIGYRSAVKPMRSFALSDTDHDFVSASSEDEDYFDRQLQNNWNMLTVLQSVPKNDPKQPLEPAAEYDTPRDVPLVVLDKTSYTL